MTNIIAFPGTKAQAPANVILTPPVLADEQAELLASIDRYIAFLQENRSKIKHFITAVTLDAGHEDGEECHTITSPIMPHEYALSLQLLQESFTRRCATATDE